MNDARAVCGLVCDEYVDDELFQVVKFDGTDGVRDHLQGNG